MRPASARCAAGYTRSGPQASTATVRPPASSAPLVRRRVDAAREARDHDEPGARETRPRARARARAPCRVGARDPTIATPGAASAAASPRTSSSGARIGVARELRRIRRGRESGSRRARGAGSRAPRSSSASGARAERRSRSRRAPASRVSRSSAAASSRTEASARWNASQARKRELVRRIARDRGRRRQAAELPGTGSSLIGSARAGAPVAELRRRACRAGARKWSPSSSSVRCLPRQRDRGVRVASAPPAAARRRARARARLRCASRSSAGTPGG